MKHYEFPYTVYHTTDPGVKGTTRWIDTRTAIEWQKSYASRVQKDFRYTKDIYALKDFMATHDVSDNYWPNAEDF